MINVDGFALITGSGSGIGRSTGFALAKCGAKGVAFADINEDSARAAAEESRAVATHPEYKPLAVSVDTRDEAKVQAMVDKTVQEFGRIDFNVNSAGIGPIKALPIMDFDVAEYENMQDVNVKGILLCMKFVMKAMMKHEPKSLQRSPEQKPRPIGRGSIVNVASISGFVGQKGMVQYNASKHAIRGVSKTAALEGASNGIRVNCLCPAWVEGPMLDRALKRSPQFADLIANLCPMGRAAQAEEVADCAVFLCSSASSFVTGTSMVADGGILTTAHDS